jgi:hypothetical protein
MAVINNKFDQIKHTPTNLNAVDLNRLGGDGTKYFNNFFDIPITISSAADDAILSFFEKIADNKDSAVALSSAVIYTSKVQGIDPMAILDEFKKLSKDQLRPYIAYFLNLSRIGTSLIGVQTVPVRNKYVTRTILA